MGHAGVDLHRRILVRGDAVEPCSRQGCLLGAANLP
jgi:hypothetical protein